ncbi:MAG: mechanosensitive ion channel family protein, partial [Polyangiales bacterium]
PKPLVILTGFGDSAINLQFSVWSTQANFLDLRNTMQQGIKAAFDQHGVEIPFPHRTLYAGSVTAPIPVKIAD